MCRINIRDLSRYRIRGIFDFGQPCFDQFIRGAHVSAFGNIDNFVEETFFAAEMYLRLLILL